jgi:hypothetical protein
MVNKRISIKTTGLMIEATLNTTNTADAIWDLLPINGSCNIWGDEIYFSIPVYLSEEDSSSDLVETGNLAYWPPGNAFCVFFGQTPASNADEVRAASPVNVFATIDGDEKLFRGVSSGALIEVSKIE